MIGDLAFLGMILTADYRLENNGKKFFKMISLASPEFLCGVYCPFFGIIFFRFLTGQYPQDPR